MRDEPAVLDPIGETHARLQSQKVSFPSPRSTENDSWSRAFRETRADRQPEMRVSTNSCAEPSFHWQPHTFSYCLLLTAARQIERLPVNKPACQLDLVGH